MYEQNPTSLCYQGKWILENLKIVKTDEFKDDKRSAKLSSRTAKDAQNRHKGGAAGLVVA